MAEQTLTHAEITHQIHIQFERLMMVEDLTRMTIEALPNSTDSDAPRALLTGMKEILAVDSAKMYSLFGRLSGQSEKAAA